MTNIFLLSLLALLVLTVPTAMMMVPSTVLASTGMSQCNDETEEEESEDCQTQADRVGNDDPNDEDADRDGPDEDSANCWGKVTSDFTTTKDGDGGGDMSHSSNPVNDPDDVEEDRETPREGVGNQVEGHPSDHGDNVGPLFGSDEGCTQD
jgi:hypothetical protein